MVVYRQVHIAFWQDSFVLELTPEEKYFYLYLMTNSKTSQCGIYELPKRIVETETGYNRETVDKLLARFVEYGKILYDDNTKEIIVRNWIKYNSMESPKVKACIERELKHVKSVRLIRIFETLCKEYGYAIDIPSIDYGEEKEIEKEREKEIEKAVVEKEAVEKAKKAVTAAADAEIKALHCEGDIPACEDEAPEAIRFYEINFVRPNGKMFIPRAILDEILNAIETMGNELVLLALQKTAIAGGSKDWPYARKILLEWYKKGIKTAEAAKMEQGRRTAGGNVVYRDSKTITLSDGSVVPKGFEVIASWKPKEKRGDRHD